MNENNRKTTNQKQYRYSQTLPLCHPVTFIQRMTSSSGVPSEYQLLLNSYKNLSAVSPSAMQKANQSSLIGDDQSPQMQPKQPPSKADLYHTTVAGNLSVATNSMSTTATTIASNISQSSTMPSLSTTKLDTAYTSSTTIAATTTKMPSQMLDTLAMSDGNDAISSSVNDISSSSSSTTAAVTATRSLSQELAGNHYNDMANQQQTVLNKSATTAATTFDYLYEFSETRKVLEDFFKCPTNEEEKKINECFNESDTGSYVSNAHMHIIQTHLSTHTQYTHPSYIHT